MRQWYLVHPKGKELSLVAQAFLEFALERYNYWIVIILMMTGLYTVFADVCEGAPGKWSV